MYKSGRRHYMTEGRKTAYKAGFKHGVELEAWKEKSGSR